MNIVLLLDNSGSMERADRVSIIREALRVLAGQLHAGDTFSIVTFARTAQLRVDGIPGNQAGAAAEEIAKLTPEGGTNLGEALELAYETARHHYLANGDNRVVLLTDGAANLGDVNADTLKHGNLCNRDGDLIDDCAITQAKVAEPRKARAGKQRLKIGNRGVTTVVRCSQPQLQMLKRWQICRNCGAG